MKSLASLVLTLSLFASLPALASPTIKCDSGVRGANFEMTQVGLPDQIIGGISDNYANGTAVCDSLGVGNQFPDSFKCTGYWVDVPGTPRVQITVQKKDFGQFFLTYIHPLHGKPVTINCGFPS